MLPIHWCLKLSVGMNLYFFVSGALSFALSLPIPIPLARSILESANFGFSVATVAVILLLAIRYLLWLCFLTLALSWRVSDVNSDSPVETSILFLHELPSCSSVWMAQLFLSVSLSICFNLIIYFSSFWVMWVNLSISSLCLQNNSVLLLTSCKTRR